MSEINRPKKLNSIVRRTQELNSQGIKEDDDSLFGELLRKGYDDDFEPSDYCKPTSEPPGSIGKLKVLTQRLQDGVTLYHPEDEKILATLAQQTEMGLFVQEKYVGRVWQNGMKMRKDSK